MSSLPQTRWKVLSLSKRKLKKILKRRLRFFSLLREKYVNAVTLWFRFLDFPEEFIKMNVR